MKSENKYIGDDKFKKFLEHYACRTPLEVIKMRFAGAICSPNLTLRPADVISSFWPKNQSPRLETKNEADLFFKFFMALWDEIFELIMQNKFHLPKLDDKAGLVEICTARYEQLEAGFIEGFWGGKKDLQMSGYLAQLIDSLSDLAQVYKSLITQAQTSKEAQKLFDAVKECDKMTEKSIKFMVENYVLPRMEELTRKVN